MRVQIKLNNFKNNEISSTIFPLVTFRDEKIFNNFKFHKPIHPPT